MDPYQKISTRRMAWNTRAPNVGIVGWFGSIGCTQESPNLFFNRVPVALCVFWHWITLVSIVVSKRKGSWSREMVPSAATLYPCIMWCAHLIMSYNGEGFLSKPTWNEMAILLALAASVNINASKDEMRWWSKCRKFKVHGVVMIIYWVSLIWYMMKWSEIIEEEELLQLT